MKLAEKILNLRKQNGLSQEEFAEKIGVSRQAVSRWENETALPDAMNIREISRFFGVSADYLLNDECEEKKNEKNNFNIKAVIAVVMIIFGAFGNFVIYILSRFIEVMVPQITYENGEKWYTWNSDILGRSYKYFIWKYNLEFLVGILWLAVICGVIFLNRKRIGRIIELIIKKIKDKV